MTDLNENIPSSPDLDVASIVLPQEATAVETASISITPPQPEAQSNEASASAIQTNSTSTPSLCVKLDAFDGPLDLLLELIHKNEMDIYDIEISEITRQYLSYLETIKSLDLEVAGEFIVLAATLIHIKSKTLLPTDEDQDDEDEGADPRGELVRKLLEYQAFKEAAKELGFLETERGKMFTRQISDYYLADLDSEDEEIDTFSADFYDLLQAFQKVITKHGRKEMHEVFEEMISIEDKMLQLQGLISLRRQVSFFNLFKEDCTRNELIATFLAILEIVKSRFATITQSSKFEDIILEKNEEELPFKFKVPSES